MTPSGGGKLPKVSSDQLIRALVRLGFQRDAVKRAGSHLTLTRARGRGIVDVAVVVQGKREVPVGTLTSILRIANVERDDFLAALKKGR